MEQILMSKNKLYYISILAASLNLVASTFFWVRPRQTSNGGSDGFFFVIIILPFLILNVLLYFIHFANRYKEFKNNVFKGILILLLIGSFTQSIFVFYATIMRP